MTVLGERAVVLGASMGGLLAARVLADFFETVTVVERDLLPDDPAVRRGVPQGRHVHVLLARGAQTFDEPQGLDRLPAENVYRRDYDGYFDVPHFRHRSCMGGPPWPPLLKEPRDFQ